MRLRKLSPAVRRVSQALFYESFSALSRQAKPLASTSENRLCSAHFLAVPGTVTVQRRYL